LWYIERWIVRADILKKVNMPKKEKEIREIETNNTPAIEESIHEQGGVLAHVVVDASVMKAMQELNLGAPQVMRAAQRAKEIVEQSSLLCKQVQPVNFFYGASGNEAEFILCIHFDPVGEVWIFVGTERVQVYSKEDGNERVCIHDGTAREMRAVEECLLSRGILREDEPGGFRAVPTHADLMSDQEKKEKEAYGEQIAWFTKFADVYNRIYAVRENVKEVEEIVHREIFRLFDENPMGKDYLRIHEDLSDGEAPYPYDTLIKQKVNIIEYMNKPEQLLNYLNKLYFTLASSFSQDSLTLKKLEWLFGLLKEDEVKNPKTPPVSIDPADEYKPRVDKGGLASPFRPSPMFDRVRYEDQEPQKPSLFEKLKKRLPWGKKSKVSQKPVELPSPYKPSAMIKNVKATTTASPVEDIQERENLYERERRKSPMLMRVNKEMRKEGDPVLENLPAEQEKHHRAFEESMIETEKNAHPVPSPFAQEAIKRNQSEEAEITSSHPETKIGNESSTEKIEREVREKSKLEHGDLRLNRDRWIESFTPKGSGKKLADKFAFGRERDMGKRASAELGYAHAFGREFSKFLNDLPEWNKGKSIKELLQDAPRSAEMYLNAAFDLEMQAIAELARKAYNSMDDRREAQTKAGKMLWQEIKRIAGVDCEVLVDYSGKAHLAHVRLKKG